MARRASVNIMKVLCPKKLLILVINAVIIGCLSRQRHSDSWEHITFRYGVWKKLPYYDKDAFKEGYVRVNDVCRSEYYHGFLFMKDNNTKTMPIYDMDGELMGIQTSIPGNMKGFNSQNQTIDLPPVEIMPPVLKGQIDKNGIQYYTVTAYFKHPSLLCQPYVSDGVRDGKGLYIQMGNDPKAHHLHIPLKSKHLATKVWMKGHCAPLMGTHYFMGLSPSMLCEKLYPLFLTYDMEGNLGAFGWVFQGRPNNFQSDEIFRLYPLTYPFLFNTSMLPPCMFHDKFQLFGVHIYLQDNKNLLCTKDIQSKPEQDMSQNNRNQRISNVILVDASNTVASNSDNGNTNDKPFKEFSGIDSVETRDKSQSSTNKSSSLKYSYCLIVILLCAIFKSFHFLYR
ncbi:hypothetical protein ACF0H5_016358 [Mactra antiquata]